MNINKITSKQNKKWMNFFLYNSHCHSILKLSHLNSSPKLINLPFINVAQIMAL